jgi:hypothetical protein
VNGQKSNGRQRQAAARRKKKHEGGARKSRQESKGRGAEPATCCPPSPPLPRCGLQPVVRECWRWATHSGPLGRRWLEGWRDDGGRRRGSGGKGREGAAVGRAGDTGADRGAQGDGAGGRRGAPQRQDDVGGRRGAAPGARLPTNRRAVQVQVEEPRQPLQGIHPSSGR